jgi:DNA polymerase (family 10)
MLAVLNTEAQRATPLWYTQKRMTKHEIGRVLEEIGFLLELKGENPYKARAYSKAASIVRNLAAQPAELLAQGTLLEVKGIGPALNQTISELVTNGASQLHHDLKSEYPGEVFANLLHVSRIPGLRSKDLRLIYDGLGISTLADLEKAATESRLTEVKGVSRRTQQRILEGIRRLENRRGRRLFGDAIAEAEELLAVLKSMPGVLDADLAGPVRRKIEIIETLNFVVAVKLSNSPAPLLRIPGIEGLEAGPLATMVGNSMQGLAVEIKCVDPTNYGEELFLATGNQEHVDAVTSLLRSPRPFRTEKDLYAAAGLPWIPPELREGQGEVEEARRKGVPVLVEGPQVQGIFHNHTVYTDGSGTVAQMAKAAQHLGYRYIGISDHSQSAFYVNGLKEDRILAQRHEINAVQETLPGIRIFKGIEADILADGALDYPDEMLATFDFVIASVHSRFNLPEEEQTQRICRALTNPYVTMLGHATGRLLLSREGYRVDLRKVIETAATYGKVIEINASRHRLDLDWRWCRYAKERGVKFSINPDAHSTEELKNVRWGVNVARKGGLTADDIINTMPVDAMAAYLGARRPNLTL